MDIDLPPILDLILTYLADNLPRPLYSFLLNFLSHFLALSSALLNVLASLLSRSPSEWDAQTVLPPLITLFAAYLAFTSIYRTATWMIRTSFWFMKWGIILGTLVAGTSWYIGATQGQAGGLMNTGLVSYLGNLALDKINGQGHNAVGGERMGNSRPLRKPVKRPKPWESFDHHRGWQYSEEQFEADEGSDVDILMKNLFDTAARVLGDGSWWTGLKNVMDTTGDPASSTQTTKKNSHQARGRASGKSHSR